MDFGLLSGVGSILGGLGGLFGKKNKTPTVQQNMLAQAQGARMASEQYGYNPLTMLQYGNTAGTGLASGGVAPLSSIELITGGLKDINDIQSGDAARRRQADQLNLDMAALKLDQARSGVVSVPIGAVNTVAKGPSPLGQRPIQVQQASGSAPNRLSMSQEHLKTPNLLASDREKNVAKLANSPGVFEIENAATGGSITIPGEGEPWGVDEFATALTVGLPQVAYNWAQRGGEALDEYRNKSRGGSDVMIVGGKRYAMEPYTPKNKREKPRKRVPQSHQSIMPRIYD